MWCSRVHCLDFYHLMSSSFPAWIPISFIPTAAFNRNKHGHTGGFRERWNKQFLARQGDGADPQFENQVETVEVGNMSVLICVQLPLILRNNLNVQNPMLMKLRSLLV